jgi:hypothetical protein
MDRDSDVNLANRVVDAARRRVVTLPPEPRMEEMYWQVLVAAAWVALAGVFSLTRTPLAIVFVGIGLALTSLATFLR